LEILTAPLFQPYLDTNSQLTNDDSLTSTRLQLAFRLLVPVSFDGKAEEAATFYTSMPQQASDK
jgi:hypothetical protein